MTLVGDGLFRIDGVEGRHVSEHAHLDHRLGAKNWANLQYGGEVVERDVVEVAVLDALLLGAGFEQQGGPERTLCRVEGPGAVAIGGVLHELRRFVEHRPRVRHRHEVLFGLAREATSIHLARRHARHAGARGARAQLVEVRQQRAELVMRLLV